MPLRRDIQSNNSNNNNNNNNNKKEGSIFPSFDPCLSLPPVEKAARKQFFMPKHSLE